MGAADCEAIGPDGGAATGWPASQSHIDRFNCRRAAPSQDGGRFRRDAQPTSWQARQRRATDRATRMGGLVDIESGGTQARRPPPLPAPVPQRSVGFSRLTAGKHARSNRTRQACPATRKAPGDLWELEGNVASKTLRSAMMAMAA